MVPKTGPAVEKKGKDMKGIASAVGAAILIAAVLVGGYLGGWWLQEDAVDREAGIRERTFARQTALQAEVQDLYRDVRDIDVQITYANDEQDAALKAQRKAIVIKLCDAYGRMTATVTIPDDIRAFAGKEC